MTIKGSWPLKLLHTETSSWHYRSQTEKNDIYWLLLPHRDFKTTGQDCSLLLWMAKKKKWGCEETSEILQSNAIKEREPKRKPATWKRGSKEAHLNYWMHSGASVIVYLPVSPITALCWTSSILNRPRTSNDLSRPQQITGQEGSGVTITQMQANSGRGHEMGSKNAHLMLSTGDLVWLPGAGSGGKPGSASGGTPTSSSSSWLQNHSSPLRGNGHAFLLTENEWWCFHFDGASLGNSPHTLAQWGEKCDCKQWLAQFISPSTAKGKELHLQPLLRNAEQNMALN